MGIVLSSSVPPPPGEPDFERVMVVARKYGIDMLLPA
jgi:hypothetical protein